GDPPPAGDCGQLRSIPLGGGASGTVTHPSGAVGTFVVEPQRHGRSNVPKLCLNWDPPINADRTNDTVKYVRDYLAQSLKTKTVTGVGLTTPMTWTYSYAPSWSWACSDPDSPTCPTPASPEVVCQSDTCAESSK